MHKFFRPKEDITAYELAMIWANVTCPDGWNVWNSNVHFSDDAWWKFSEAIKRHFQDTP